MSIRGRKLSSCCFLPLFKTKMMMDGPLGWKVKAAQSRGVTSSGTPPQAVPPPTWNSLIPARACRGERGLRVHVICQPRGDLGKFIDPLSSGFIFPGGSAGKESACNAGDPGSIPGLGRSTGEGIDYPLQYSWSSLVAQLVKNPPAVAGHPGLTPGLGRSHLPGSK